MTFARVWPGGLPFDYPPGSANLTALDVQVARAVDGDGGSYAPAAPLIIGGAGLQIAAGGVPSGGVFTVVSGGTLVIASGGLLDVAGDLSVGGTLTISGSVTFSAPRSYTRSVKGTIWFNASEWEGTSNGTVFNQANAPNSGGSLTPVSWVLDVPPGSTITSITWYIDPAGGHVTLPAVMPSLLVREYNPADGTSVNVVTLTDTSASIPVYEAAHTVSSGVLSYGTNQGRTVVASMLGEKGAGEVSGGLFYPPIVTFTRTSMSEA